jgi:hypothetical protein
VTRRGDRILRRSLLAGAAVMATVVHVPRVLAFPHAGQFGSTAVLAEQPIEPARMRVVLDRADALVSASPLARPGLSRTIVLTDGGWRWRLLSLTSSGAFAIRRPLGHTLVFNRNDVAADAVFNREPVGNRRTLSGTIAHETTHILVAEHFGEWRAPFFPTWKTEGYRDFVARESSLFPSDAAKLRARDPGARALIYFDARRRVAATLAANRGSVDALFEQ